MENIKVKTCITSILILLYSSGLLFSQWTDDFSDGNFIQAPVWKDDSSVFMVNASGQLQLNAPARDNKSYMYIPSYPAINASWEFNVKMDFNPSSTSYCRIFLMADKQHPANVSSGYFLRIGGTNDDICLYQKNGTTETLLINGRDKILNTTTVNSSIKVTRTTDGKWELYCDSTGNTNYAYLGETTENSIIQSNFFIIECIYIASRSTRFNFDNFKVSGETYSDGTIPSLLSLKPISGRQIHCIFSEPIVDTASCKFIINESFSPVDIEIQQEKIVLSYPTEFNCETNNKLFISGIKDEWNNAIKDTFVNFTFCTPQLFDIVFNEIMADPDPPLQLPEAEYIELYNRSNKTFRTENWKLTIGSSSFLLPDTQIPGGSYMLICAQESKTAFEKYGSVLGLLTSSTTLTNSGQTLHLYNTEGKLISWLEYSDTWYGDDYKAEGGWSIEQIDPGNPCSGIGNWTASKSKTGGTPGTQNSVYAENTDFQTPEIKWVFSSNDTSIILTFNEPLLSGNALLKEDFQISPDIGSPKYAALEGTLYNKIKLTLCNKLVNDKIYNLTINPNIADCAGNKINTAIDTLIGLPGQTDSLDIVINEILFNPLAYNPEYIELYNRSDKILDGSNLVLTFTNAETNNTFVASNDAFLLYPHSYLLICPEPEPLPNLYTLYDKRAVHACQSWKSLEDKSGTIILRTKDLQIIDKFDYNESMHQSILTNKEGISLERVNPDIATNFPGNWHSAAETVQYGTPGKLNSQNIKENTLPETFTIENEIFSPDNDGYNDILKINYHFEKPGYHISAWVFDAIGRKVSHILNNVSPENTGMFFWDGISDEGKICYPGIYIIFIRLVNDNGEVNEFKKVCVLAIKR